MRALLLCLLCLAVLGSAHAERLQLDKQGLVLRADDGRELDRFALRAKRWDQRQGADGQLTALVADANSGRLHWLQAQDGRLRLQHSWDSPRLNLACLALYRDAQGLLQAVLLDEGGRSEQWLLSGPRPRLLREWATPPSPTACQVRDAEAQLYVVEEGLGLWQLAVDAEREGRRLLLHDPAIQPEALARWLAGHAAVAADALPVLPVLLAQAQTAPVASRGDAADDPAIWVHPRRPAQSRILGSNKKQGLLVYDLQGRQLQLLEVGRINNVDLRQGLRYGDQALDLAVATQRDEAALVVFAISSTGRVSELARLPTGLDDVYGLCTLRNAGGRLEAVVNDKDGRVRQFELQREAGRWRAELRREFRLASQPEGCVVDEASDQLFIGEEDRGVWRLAANSAAPALPELVLPVGATLQADVEGLAVYRRGSQRYLLVSSQGNDSYALFDLLPPHAPRGAFRIGINAAAGIDGASETDGLEISAANLGAPFEEGLLVVQDGRKALPLGTQNFKLLPWAKVREALKLD